MAKGCAQCLRVFVIIINLIFMIFGLAILGGALYLYFDPSVRSVKESSGMQMRVDIALFVAMGIGGLTVLMSTFGCCGAYHESTCLLSTFFTIVLLICCVEIAGGIFLFFRRDEKDVQRTIADSIRQSIRGANETTVPQHIRYLQYWQQCCGANGTADYDNEKTAKAVCKSDDGTEYTEGCAGKLSKFIQTNAIWALVVILSVAAVELLSVILAMALCCSLRHESDGYIGVTTD